jgi:hypothetical protein
MIYRSLEATEFGGPRWQAVRFGLRLASSWFGAFAIGLFYLLWVLIGFALCFVLIPFTILGKADAFNHAVNQVGLYGFLLPIGLMVATTWAVKLFSRLLWCAIPEPLAAALLAFASLGGRLSVLVGATYLWIWREPFGQALLRAEVVVCSAAAWLGLAADWVFIRSLRKEFLPDEDSARPTEKFETAAEIVDEERVTEPRKKSVFTRQFDPGAWLKSRFPRTHKFFVWILAPVAYVTISSLADNGDPHAIPQAIFRLGVVSPVILQVFWTPYEDKLKDLCCRFGHR